MACLQCAFISVYRDGVFRRVDESNTELQPIKIVLYAPLVDITLMILSSHNSTDLT